MIATPHVIDLTHAITPDMPVFPGTPQPEFTVPFTLEAHGFLEHEIRLTTHTGTHLDAPAHMLAGGRTLDVVPAAQFLGPATVLDVTALDDGDITVEHLQPHQDRLAGKAYVLLRTGWSRFWGDDAYFRDFPALTEAAALWLIDLGVTGVGVDAVSIDRGDSSTYPVHHALLGRDVVIVENLTGLDALVGRDFTFCCLPLKIAGGDGSPVRAVALL